MYSSLKLVNYLYLVSSMLDWLQKQHPLVIAITFYLLITMSKLMRSPGGKKGWFISSELTHIQQLPMGNINADFINLLIKEPELSHLPSKQIKCKVIFSWIEGAFKTKLPPTTLRTMDKMILHNRMSPSTAISEKHPILILLLPHSWRNYVTHCYPHQVNAGPVDFRRNKGQTACSTLGKVT